MARMPQHFDKRCPCTAECAKRSAECRKACKEYAAYAEIKRAEYARKLKNEQERRIRTGASEAQKSRARKRQRDAKATGGRVR